MLFRSIALRCVYEIARCVSLPIIGTGGISTGTDAAEMLMAGASLVGIGSAVWQDGPAVFARIGSELLAFMQTAGYESVESLCGRAITQ